MNAKEKERHEEARFLAQPTTPKSERLRSSYGSLQWQMPGGEGYCPAPRCLKKANHRKEHWPK